MASLTLRLVKGSPLTNTELDGNFTALNNELATKLNATYAAMVATLGFTPYNATNPAGYVDQAGARSAISVTGSLSYNPTTGVLGVDVPVTSVFGRTGAVVLGSSDVTTALGFTPYNATNPSGYITSSALSSYLPLNGGAVMTGMLQSYQINAAMAASNADAAIEVSNVSGTGDSALAMLRFHCRGQYGIKMGLRADGYFGLGGWSRAAWSWYSAPDGSMVAAGNVTAYSDEKLKKNWRDLPADFIERLARVKYGIYDRIDEEGLTQVGVSAQSLRNAMPHAVMKGLDDTLTVAYGNAALTAAIALSQRVVDQEARISELERLAAL